MRNDNNIRDNSSFWISYADLMAGLLFVFILLIGAIVTKYMLSQTELKRAKVELAKQQEELLLSQGKINERQLAINEFLEQLNTAKDSNIKLGELNKIFSSKLNKLNSDIQDINQTLAFANEKNTALNSIIFSKDEEILNLKNQLSSQIIVINKLNNDLNRTKVGLKNLKLIKLNVIKAIKDKLGNKIYIDLNSGSVSLPTSVLFNLDSYKLKDDAKFDLRRMLTSYLDVLLSPKIKPYLGRIIIEGHTDSKGSYLYNLELSQKRAYEVMKFIYSFYKDKELQNYLLASGRSFSDLVYDKNGKEDAAASRRIEIKFNISDKTTIEEIQKILQNQNSL